MSGYRGFLRELARTGSRRALGLQLRTGAAHWLRRLLPGGRRDGVALFLQSYAADGLRPHDPDGAAAHLDAQACLVCGLCSAACAEAGGTPPLDPRDAVLAGARLQIDVLRLALPVASEACGACRACEPACPAGIPIARVQTRLASLGEDGAAPA